MARKRTSKKAGQVKDYRHEQAKRKEFIELREELADYEDLRELRKAKAKEGDAPTISFEEAKKQLNIE